MIRINIYITEEQWEALKKLVTVRVKLSEHIRRAVDEYLEKRGPIRVDGLEGPEGEAE